MSFESNPNETPTPKKKGLGRAMRKIGLATGVAAAGFGAFKAGEKVRLLVSKKENVLKKTFGITKFSRSTGQILKEVDKEAWDE